VASGQVNSASAASRYGAAIFDLASDTKSLTRVEKELSSLRKMINSSAPLREMIASPLVSTSDMSASLRALASKAKFSPLVGNSLAVIAENGRASDMLAIIDAFFARLAAAKGTLAAHAKTATALSAKQKTDLTASLKKALGRTVKLETEVDPRLLGGLIVQVGSRMFDSSLKTQLEGLKLTMKES
jgi:F-type H+-transporting ATPase subunit delta